MCECGSHSAITLENTLVILSTVAPDAGRYYAQAVNDKNGENKTSQPITLTVESKYARICTHLSEASSQQIAWAGCCRARSSFIPHIHTRAHIFNQHSKLHNRWLGKRSTVSALYWLLAFPFIKSLPSAASSVRPADVITPITFASCSAVLLSPLARAVTYTLIRRVLGGARAAAPLWLAHKVDLQFNPSPQKSRFMKMTLRERRVITHKHIHASTHIRSEGRPHL